MTSLGPRPPRCTFLPLALPQEFVKLVSAEGAEFWVDRKCAMVSGTIKAMLSGAYVMGHVYTNYELQHAG